MFTEHLSRGVGPSSCTPVIWGGCRSIPALRQAGSHPVDFSLGPLDFWLNLSRTSPQAPLCGKIRKSGQGLWNLYPGFSCAVLGRSLSPSQAQPLASQAQPLPFPGPASPPPRPSSLTYKMELIKMM